MGRYVSKLGEVDRTLHPLVGGKGAHLGELSRIEEVIVPPGFCVTTEAFRRVVEDAPGLAGAVARLSQLTADDGDAIRTVSAQVRMSIEETRVPDDIASAITGALASLGEGAACAVRSSATAEDLPTASFAGQHDTYLNIVGRASVVEHVVRCWASLFSERAVIYRMRHDIDHRQVRMAVVVQRMVFPDAAGILFTADPVTGNRRVVTVEASFGLGEALVSGLTNADVFKVRGGEIVERSVARKPLATRASTGGGTQQQAVEAERIDRPALTDAQVLRLADIGRRIEAHFGLPQDIEWCVAGDAIHIVQSRPITTLFPIPERDDDARHVYLSVGHQQMMTDAMKPLGISLWKLTAAAPMHDAGGRLFVDVTRQLSAPASRAALMGLAGRSDPLVGDALQAVVARADFLPLVADAAPAASAGGVVGGAAPGELEADPGIVAELIAASEASLAALRHGIRGRSGPALVDFIVEDVREMRRILFDPRSLQVIMAAVNSAWWLNEKLQEWLGEKNAADVLAHSVPDNVTSEMGLALLDVADVIRRHPDVVAYLQGVRGDDFLDGLPKLEGGEEARRAIEAWLDRYGMRGPGEIDITRPRWRERPAMLVPLILGNVRNFTAGAGERRFEQGRREAADKEHELLERLRASPDGERRAEEAGRKIRCLRTFSGYREYPKYFMISRYFIYKLALVDEAARLARAGVLRERDDVFFLTLQELQEVARTGEVDGRLIAQRKEAFRSYQALTPPRVLTSDGESVVGEYRRGALPAGALVGLPVSAGTVEGRARVILDMGAADVEPGDILVTRWTDPSWTPLFVAVAGLVTEVGGLMTHGAVIAREYGLPAVVGLEHATRLIRDGQRIRVHGTEGYVELLS